MPRATEYDRLPYEQQSDAIARRVYEMEVRDYKRRWSRRLGIGAVITWIWFFIIPSNPLGYVAVALTCFAIATRPKKTEQEKILGILRFFQGLALIAIGLAILLAMAAIILH